ncbi:hypothetical protein F3Y22_tig00110482pilonHSYRG00370 [Hibiscus syriacus]|uniref:Uncharacterized protein n=1 Tax=Hibiscus syriacus TaxID=106335 RepID=A0A6A3AH61_HIBSY|nr:hypothetical protein F3Y22_tig00110482pilonHSYRG00370 [Hibiscus syriacus]
MTLKNQMSISSAESGFFTSGSFEDYGINDREMETLVSSSRSFSTDSPSEMFNTNLKIILETKPTRQSKKKPKKIKKKRRYAIRFSSLESKSPTRLSSFLQRMIPCTVDGRVRESFVVVKKWEFSGGRSLFSEQGGLSRAVARLGSGRVVVVVMVVVSCGAELAVLFVDALVKGKIPYSEDILDLVRKIYKVFPKVLLPSNVADDDDDVREVNEALGAAKTRLEGFSSFLSAAIKWSAEFGASRKGDPQLHVMLAEYIYSESTELVGLK